MPAGAGPTVTAQWSPVPPEAEWREWRRGGPATGRQSPAGGALARASAGYTDAPVTNARNIQAIFSWRAMSPVRKSLVPIS